MVHKFRIMIIIQVSLEVDCFLGSMNMEIFAWHDQIVGLVSPLIHTLLIHPFVSNNPFPPNYTLYYTDSTQGRHVFSVL